MNKFIAKYGVSDLKIDYMLHNGLSQFGFTNVENQAVCKISLGLESLNSLISRLELADNIIQKADREADIRYANSTVQNAYNEYKLLLALVDNGEKQM